MTENDAIHRGLKGVCFDRSQVCCIDSRAGELRYRGYSIHDLAEHSAFEKTCYLLFHGALPKREQLGRFTSEPKTARTLPSEVSQLIEIIRFIICDPSLIGRSVARTRTCGAQAIEHGSEGVFTTSTAR